MPTTPDRAVVRRIGAAWVAAVALAVAVPARSAPPAADVAATATPATPVVLVAVPDLRWSDLAAMPHLRALAAHASVGELSVRSEGDATRCGDALLELSAGTRVPSGVGPCDIGTATLARLREHYRHSRYGARIGLLGDTVGDMSAVGPAAAVVASTSTGPARVVPADTASGGGSDVVVVDEALYGAASRAAAAAGVDARLDTWVRRAPPGAVTIVAGISDAPTGGPRLHPIVVAGPGWPHRELTSGSTGRAPYVQLFDVTATVMALSGVAEPPRTVSGRAVRPSSAPARALSTYADLDRHARRALSVGHPTFTVLCCALIVALLLLLLRPGLARWPARLVVFGPVVTWLVQLLPWWRMSVPAYAALVVGGCVVGAALTWLAGRSSPRRALVLGPAVTAAVLVADQLAGSRLQISAPLGDNPLVAGRFHGMGNIDFAVCMSAALLCVALAAANRPRRGAVAIVVLAGLALVVVDGAPPLGDDVGGVLALVPALALLAALVARARLTARRVVPVLVGAVAVAAAVALADYARPADRRTHAGRFVEDVVRGDAWRTLHRKLDAVLSSFTNPAVTGLVVLAVLVAVVVRRRATAGAGTALAPADALVPALAAVAVLALLGSALNDSGVFVAAAALLTVGSPVLAAGFGPDLGDTRRL